MKLKKLSAAFAVVVAAGLLGSGCAKDPNILDQQAKAKTLPPPTAEMLQKGFARVAAGQADAKAQERAWVKAHPDQVAEVNAERAKAGKPPLGE